MNIQKTENFNEILSTIHNSKQKDLGEGKNPTKGHLARLAKKYGLKQGDETILQVQEAVGKWQSFAKSAGVSKKSIDTIEKVLNEL